MNRFEIEVHCPECGGTDFWPEGQHLKKCSFCASLLYFEPKPDSRFYLSPTVQTENQLKSVIVVYRAEKQRAEDTARYPGENRENEPEMLSVPTRPLAPYLAEFERKVSLEKCRLIYVPYWHFQAVLTQCLLARSEHDVREYQMRSTGVDEALPAYDDTRWNFRDRGLRFGQAKLKEATTELLSQHPHLAFRSDIESQLDRMINTFPPLVRRYDFRSYRLCNRQRLAILRPYWIVRFACDEVESVLVDACYGSVAGHPNGLEANALLLYGDMPYITSEPAQIRVLPARCPVCGFDIDWSADEVIHFCTNCGRALALRNSEIQTAPYDYATLPDSSWCHLPFWKLRVKLQCKGRTYTGLKSYFRESFQERILRKGPYGDSLWIPAVQPKRMEKGDEFFAALIADATACSPALQEGPVVPSGALRPAVRLDSVTASEIAACALPSASGVPTSLHKLVSVSRMLRETSVEVTEVRLVLVPYRTQQQDILVGTQRFSVKLLAPL
jgi:predicted RNA-binding Zn-ribbon protein involved in translation (DUF1610 family)